MRHDIKIKYYPIVIFFVILSFVFVVIHLEYKKYAWYYISAYCACKECCEGYADGITASGYVLTETSKVCAAPKNIPFGTRFDIPHYGIATVEDRGKAITGDRLDIYFSDHDKAIEWGVKKLHVKRLN